MSLSSRLSAIFSSPLSPKALAISRLPAGRSDDWMNSTICSREASRGRSCGAWRYMGLAARLSRRMAGRQKRTGSAP
jgi:hypothetical protein